MAKRETSATDTAARQSAEHFGALVRERREQLKLRQEDLVFSTGVGRRFIIDLEAGKPSCQLGKALVVAVALGLRPLDVMSATADAGPLLPDLPEDLGDGDGR